MIRRSPRKRKFTLIPNGIIEDIAVGWRDLGLMVFLLSKPDHWEVSVSHLAKYRKSGRDAIYASLKRLRDSGYVYLQRHADGSTEWVICDDKPHTEKPTHKKPHTENPDRENPDRDNPTQVNTDSLVITDLTDARGETPAESPPQRSRCPYGKIVELYHTILPELPTVVDLTDKRKRAISARWKNGMHGLDNWQTYFEHVRESKFLMGKVDPPRGRKQFLADIDFLIREATIVSTQEGKYHR